MKSLFDFMQLTTLTVPALPPLPTLAVSEEARRAHRRALPRCPSCPGTRALVGHTSPADGCVKAAHTAVRRFKTSVGASWRPREPRESSKEGVVRARTAAAFLSPARHGCVLQFCVSRRWREKGGRTALLRTQDRRRRTLVHVDVPVHALGEVAVPLETLIEVLRTESV